MLGRTLKIFAATALLLSTLISCESVKSTRGNRILATGKVGEILVVCEPGLWQTDIKPHLDTGLTRFITPYLPDVATFEIVHRTPQHFERGNKRFRNLMFVKVDPNYTGTAAKIEKRLDVWADDQLVIDIIGKDYNQILAVCQQGLDEVHDEFDYMSWKRILNRINYSNAAHVSKKVQDNFGIKLSLPKGSKIVTTRKNFYRIEFPESARPIEFVGSGSQDMGDILSGVMVYQYDYVDESQFELQALLNARDTMLKYNVPSEVEGMYMGTQYVEIFYPEMDEMVTANEKINGYEMRGMFVFKGRPRFGTGGAFWAFHFLNPKTNKVMCVSGYVDAPATTSWTHPLREVQAVLKSVEIP